MAKSNKAKWMIGLTGTALSAFVIGQIGGNQPNASSTSAVVTKSMTAEEKKFVQLDWTNYEINGAAVIGGTGQSDRQTRRS